MTVKEMGAARRKLGGLLAFGAEPALRKISKARIISADTQQQANLIVMAVKKENYAVRWLSRSSAAYSWLIQLCARHPSVRAPKPREHLYWTRLNLTALPTNIAPFMPTISP